MNKGRRELSRLMRRYPGFSVDERGGGVSLIAPTGERMAIGGMNPGSLRPESLKRIERWLAGR